MRVHACRCHIPSMADGKDAKVYEIRVRGVLGETLLSAFPTLHGTAEDGITVLVGPLPDQAALYGVLTELQCLGLELLSVQPSASLDS